MRHFQKTALMITLLVSFASDKAFAGFTIQCSSSKPKIPTGQGGFSDGQQTPVQDGGFGLGDGMPRPDNNNTPVSGTDGVRGVPDDAPAMLNASAQVFSGFVPPQQSRQVNRFRNFIAKNPNAQCSAKGRGISCVAANGRVVRFRKLDPQLANSMFNQNVQLAGEQQINTASNGYGLSVENYISSNMSTLSWSAPEQTAFANPSFGNASISTSAESILPEGPGAAR